MLNQDRALKLVNKRLLMNWRRSQWNEIRRKTFNVPLQCIHGTVAFWDKEMGCRLEHSSSVAANYPDVLQGQPLQQLVM